MGKTLADAMSAQPGPESLAYWLAPLQGYWDRQGRMAQDGLTMADQGAQSVRAGNMGGLAGLLLGPANYLASPINALFPERSEIEAAGDVPQWSKPLLAGGLEAAAIMAPGPKGSRLGKGLDQLGDAATDAERLALQARLEAEAAQTGGQAVATSRDQALRNLTEAPGDPWRRPSTPMEMRTEGLGILNKMRPLEAALKKAMQNGDSSQVQHIRAKLKPLQEQFAPLRDYARPT